MALSGIAICSRALMKLGADGITSFEDGTAEAEVAASLYGPVRDALLSAYPWSFATGQIGLARLAAEPVADYAYAYQLPSDFLRVLSAGVSGRGRGIQYRIAERRLHTDASEVTLTYIFRPDEQTFPAFFDQALIARLAAEFCIPLTDSTSRSEVLTRLAESGFQQAKLIDGQQESSVYLEDFSLVEVRS